MSSVLTTHTHKNNNNKSDGRKCWEVLDVFHGYILILKLMELYTVKMCPSYLSKVVFKKRKESLVD